MIKDNGDLDFSLMPDVDTLSKELGVSESLIDAMFKKMNQYGADLDFSEAADNLRGLRQQVVESGNELDEETKKKYTFDIDAGEGIESAEELTDVLEDQKKQIEDTKELLEDRKVALEAKRAELESIEADTAKELAELQAQADAARTKIDERLLAAYDRIRHNVRNGLAVVTVKRDACGGCFNRIPPQRQLDIRMSKKIIVCEYCGRILVSDLLDKDTANE